MKYGALFILIAGAAATAQQGPAVRPLGPVQAVSAESFGDLVFVRHLKSGGVLVNDVRGRKVVRLDDKLASAEVIADSTPATANAYSGRVASLIAYKGDSSLFIDAQSMSMLVVNPAGQLTGRVMSIPRSQDAMVLGNQIGNATFDPAGKLIYRSMPRPTMPQVSRPANPGAAGSAGAPAFQMPDIPDSAAIVRLDLASRALDTVGFVKTPKIRMNVEQNEGRISMTSMVNPLPLVDDWAVMSDGSVAMIRGRDYHVDFVRPDGASESAAKMPFDWQRLSDDDKRAFIDSVKAARERLAANAPTPLVPGGGPTQQTTVQGGPGGGGGAGGGGQRVTMSFDMGGGAGPGGPGGPGGARGAGPGGGPNMVFVPPEELPDYKPPFFVGNARADVDGRLWVRTIPTKGVAGGPVYDVVNTKGELIERVQVPVDRSIIGFGAGGVVYLRVGETSKLERASYK